MSAWLPSRRSVDSHRGALVIRREGHCRSGRSMPLTSWKERYFAIGIREDCWALWGVRVFMVPLRLVWWCAGHERHRDEGPAAYWASPRQRRRRRLRASTGQTLRSEERRVGKEWKG